MANRAEWLALREFYLAQRKNQCREAGRKGGLATAKKYGRAHMSAIGRMGAYSYWRNRGQCGRKRGLIYMGM